MLLVLIPLHTRSYTTHTSFDAHEGTPFTPTHPHTHTHIYTHPHAAHKNWVLYVAWSPDGKKVVSGGMDNELYMWDPKTGTTVGKPFKGHRKWITCISWEPYHLNPDCTRFASSSKDGTVKIWDTVQQKCLLTLSTVCACARVCCAADTQGAMRARGTRFVVGDAQTTRQQMLSLVFVHMRGRGTSPP